MPRRRLTRAYAHGLALAAALTLASPMAAADPAELAATDPSELAATDPIETTAADPSELESQAGEVEDPAGKQELGAHLGLALGGRVSPGGLHIGGRYLYRLSELDWFDGGVGFTIGGGQASCFRDRDGAMVCDQGTLDGVGADLSLGIRRFLTGREEFRPYVHGGLALRVASFGDDDLQGIAIPLWIGGGVRASVHDGISVGGGAVVSAGPGWFNRELGIEPQFSLLVSAGVEFRID